MKRILLILAVLAAVALVVWVFLAPRRAAEPSTPLMSAEEALDAARAFYESRPLYEQPHPYSEVPEGLPDLRAETCGACHQEIYKEWALSTHRRAWLDDAQFQEELAKSRGDHAADGEEKTDVSWMCVNCHTPMVNQLERLVVGLEDGDIGKPIYVDNPVFDPELQLDAITCATCHVKDGVVYGPYGDTDAPHPTARGESLLTEETCTRCHQAEAMFPEQNLGCFFTTGAEWKASAASEQGQTCQSCHMPEVTRKVAEAFDVPERKTRRHWFGGSLIPKHPDYAEELEPLRAVYGSGATIEVREADDGAVPCEDAEVCTPLVVRVTNSNAGHLVPTGDPERHADIRAVARAADGRVLAEAELRVGSIYEWWPEIRLKSDNRIPPGEHLDLALPVPTDEPFEVEVVADKYRMHKEAFDYHELEDRYVRGRRFHRSTWNILAGEAPKRTSLEDDKHPK